MINKLLLNSIIFSGLTVAGFGQAPSIQWEISYGGTASEFTNSIIELPGKGFAIVGATLSVDGDIVGNHGGYGDVWYLETDSLGTIVRSKCFGGSGDEGAYSIDKVGNNGFYLGGFTTSCDGDVSSCIGGADYWLLRVDSNLNILWEKTYGGTDADVLRSIKTTPDGGCVLFGYTLSVDGDVTGAHTCNGCSSDMWILKVDSLGNVEWNRALGSTGNEWGYDITLSPDGGYVMAGNAELVNGDVTYSNGLSDYWVIKLNSSGQLVWQHCLGGSDQDLANSILATPDGGYIVSGSTQSSDGDVSINHGYEDNWIVKLDSLGNIIWENSIGGSNADRGYIVRESSNGSYLVLSETLSSDGQVIGFHGYTDIWLSKIDSIGNLLWQRALGGSFFDEPTGLLVLNNNDCIVLGYSNSTDGDVSGNHGGTNCTQSESCLDGWAVKLSTITNEETISNSVKMFVYPNPAKEYFSIKNLRLPRRIFLYSFSGIKIKQFELKSTEEKLDISYLSPGVYFLKTEEGAVAKLLKY